MLVLGVDPGTRVTGYGVLDNGGRSPQLVDYGIIRLNREDQHGDRLKQIYDGLCVVIDRFRPDQCSIEMPVYGKNPQSMLKLGRAQAAAMLAALNHGMPVSQYNPKEVKKSVTGNGNAAKEQVWFMVRSILAIGDDHPVLKLDASDALAVGLCHANRASFGAPKQYSGWDAFINANPKRVR